MARQPKGLKLTKREVSQTFDLEEIFGISFKGKPHLRDAISQAFIDAIIDRSEEGKDRSGKDLRRYSKQYINSDEFKDFGKRPSEINMTLTGDMLESIDAKKGKSIEDVKIHFKGKTENAKAYGHMTGMKGHKKIKKGVKREFFGLTQKQVDKIKSKFKERIDSIKRENRETLTANQVEARAVGDFITNDRRSDDELFDDIFGSLSES